MKTNRNLIPALAAVLVLVALTTDSRADMTILRPSEAVLLPAGQGESGIVMGFELDGLRAGPGRRVTEALLEWTTSDIQAESSPLLTVHGLSEAWTSRGIQEGHLPATEEGVRSEFRVSARPLAGTEGRVRFDVTELVQSWVADPRLNHGLRIGFGGLSRDAVSRQVNLPVLTIRYGFLR